MTSSIRQRLAWVAAFSFTLALPVSGQSSTQKASTEKAASGPASVAEVIDKTISSVVAVNVLFEKINSPGRTSRTGVDSVRIERPGSGVIVNDTGLVLTNAHLVAEASNESGEYWIQVELPEGGSRRASIIHLDEATDLALIQVQASGLDNFTALPLGKSRDQSVGSAVVALCLPGGIGGSAAFAGVLAFPAGPVKLREATLEPWQTLLSDCRIHDLLDGGPLLNNRGEIIGIHNSSHISATPSAFGGDDEDEEEKPDLSYPVIVSSEAISKSMATFLADFESKPPTLEPSGVVEEAPIAIAKIAPSIVSVWHASDAAHPLSADAADPQSQRLPNSLGSGVIVDASGLVLASKYRKPRTLLEALLPDVEDDGDAHGGEGADEDAGGDADEDSTEEGDAGEQEEGDEAAAADEPLSDKTTVCLADGTMYSAHVVATAAQGQVMLLKLDLPEGVTLPVATMVDSDKIAQGEFAAVVARPYHGAVNASVGILSALERDGLVQLASWVHPGHRGGAVVDREGRVFGIVVPAPETTRGAGKDSYLGFAAPITQLLRSLKDDWYAQGTTNVPDTDVPTELSAIAKVAEMTRSSLVNVMVSKAAEKKATGFDPFGGGEEEEYLPLGQGSGVIVEATGLAISNWHVVDAALAEDGTQSPNFKVEVTLPDGRKFVARVLSTSRDDDLSLLSLEIGPDDRLVPVQLGDSDALHLGQTVVAIGNPLGLANSVSVGILGNLNFTARIRGRLREYFGMLMTDAAINPGNSGGALLDLEGRLLGINTAGSVGRGMAIPVNKVRRAFSDKLLSAKSLRTAYLGVTAVERKGQLLLDEVDEKGPAYRAGARMNDKVLALAGQGTATKAAFARVALGLDADAVCIMRVERAGAELALEIHPISFAAWEIAQICGIEVEALDYAKEAVTIHGASILLHQSYTQNDMSEPSRLMAGALRVTQVNSLMGKDKPPVEPGDLLLGVTTYTSGTASVAERLIRFEKLSDLSNVITPLATKEGGRHRFWLLRDGEIVSVDVFVRRPPRI